VDWTAVVLIVVAILAGLGVLAVLAWVVVARAMFRGFRDLADGTSPAPRRSSADRYPDVPYARRVRR
jgi:hypothetical protein